MYSIPLPAVTMSLDQEIGDHNSTKPLALVEMMASRDPDPERALLDHERQHTQLRECLARMNKRERSIVRLYFWEDLSLAKIGLKLNLSRERVRQILIEGLQAARGNLQRAPHKVSQPIVLRGVYIECAHCKVSFRRYDSKQTYCSPECTVAANGRSFGNATCVACDTPFEKPAARSRYCSYRCQRDAETRKRRERSGNQPLCQPRTCEACQQQFMPKSSNQKVCGPACATAKRKMKE